MKKNLPLIIGIALPLIFIALVSFAIFIPQLGVKPKHNFVYTTSERYYAYDRVYQNTYTVRDNKIVLSALAVPVATKTPEQIAPPLYLYDVTSQTSHQISFEEAKKYTVDQGPSSPDGYIISYAYNNQGIFEIFGSNGNNSGYVISKGNAKKNLNGLVRDQYWGSNELKVIGWVLN
jgi:hypothetical protein